MPYLGLVAMVVDDNEFTADLIKKLLLHIGFSEAHVDTSPKKALSRLVSRRVDLICCDYEMDEMNGVEFTKRVRFFCSMQEGRGPNAKRYIPIISITAHAEKDIVVSLLKSGADGVLIKPINPSILKQRVDTVLKTRL